MKERGSTMPRVRWFSAVLLGWLAVALWAATPALATPVPTPKEPLGCRRCQAEEATLAVATPALQPTPTETCECAAPRHWWVAPTSMPEAAATPPATLDLAASLLSAPDDSADQPTARGVLYWMAGCGHCEEVLNGVLPVLQAQYGSQLDIQLVEVVTLEDTNQLYATAAAHGVPKEQVGVPLLIMNGQVLVGSQQIPQQMPALVAQTLAAGGAEQPSLAQLDADFLAELAATAPVRPNGFGLAIAIMVGMVGSLVYTGISLARGSSGIAGAVAQRAPWLYPLLIAVGLGVALYLSYVETQMVEAVCGPVGDCNTVQSSPYSRLFGMLPIGVVGALGYVAILAAWLVSRRGGEALARLASGALFGFTLFGVLFSLYLTYLEPFVIRAVCIWCLTSAVIITLLLLLSIDPALQAVGATEDDE